MQLLSVNDVTIRIAADALKNGCLVAFPTETVYGLGGDAFNVSSLAGIFAAKQRPYFDPLIVHIAEMDILENIVDMQLLDKPLRKKLDVLCKNLWPGPLTLILPKQVSVPTLVTSGLPTVAVRFPSNETAQKLIRYSTGAVAAPSANLFGYLSPTRAEHVKEQLGERVDIILDGGRTGIGIESTVLDISDDSPRILRLGGTEREKIEALIGAVESGNNPISVPNSPGQLRSHYAPKTRLVLCSCEEMLALHFDNTSAYLFFNRNSQDIWGQTPSVCPQNPTENIYTLSEQGNLLEAAANLFDLLHKIDKTGVTVIYAERVPMEGLGLAINDRLSRAAARSA